MDVENLILLMLSDGCLELSKNLRGDSMSDVIFNGSGKESHLGSAVLNLFDNSSGKVGGEYAAFNEISVRVMTRDSQSSYYINNTKCRRKDVQDIFLEQILPKQ